jgi:hypothetical protein
MGAYPVQTDTACTSEWFVSGKTGTAVAAISVEGLASAISSALEVAKSRHAFDVTSDARLVRGKAERKRISQVSNSFYN